MNTPTSLQQEKYAQWKALCDFLCKWFHLPDLESLQVMLACYVSHFYLKDRPVWLFLLGDSGGGKSTIAMRCLEHLGTHSVVDISPQAWISAHGDGNGILEHFKRVSGGNGIITMSDFSTILGKSYEDREMIMAQFRRIQDGEYAKWAGNKRVNLTWKGKITLIAACTPALEKNWGAYKKLGERFMTLRWHSGDSDSIMTTALTHIGKETAINSKMRKLVREFVDYESLETVWIDRTASLMESLIPLALFVAEMRVHVEKESHGKERIPIGDSGREIPTRIILSMANLARANATMFRREVVGKEDIHLAARLGLDTIPRWRLKYLQELMNLSKDEWVGKYQICRDIGQNRTSGVRELQDMQYLGLLKFKKQGTGIVKLTDKARKLLKPIWREIEEYQV